MTLMQLNVVLAVVLAFVGVVMYTIAFAVLLDRDSSASDVVLFITVATICFIPLVFVCWQLGPHLAQAVFLCFLSHMSLMFLCIQ